MKAQQVLGMLKITGHPDPEALAERYSIPVLQHNGEIERVPFATVRNGCVYIPRACYRGQYSWTSFPAQGFAAPSVELRQYQLSAAKTLIEKPDGMLRAPAGAGKTIIMGYVVWARDCRALVVVPTIDIAHQWRDTFRMYYIDAGLVGGGQHRGGAVTITTYQSAFKLDLQAYGTIVIDECHRAPCNTIRDILAICPAAYRYGCTATPWRADGMHKALNWLLGGITSTVEPEAVEGYIHSPRILRVDTHLRYDMVDRRYLLDTVAHDPLRNRKITRVCMEAVGQGHSVLMLGDSLEQLEDLQSRIHGAAFVHGRTKKRERQQVFADLRAGIRKVLLATYQLAAEGLDVPRASALLMCTPTGNQARITQACGRIARMHSDKLDPVVFDFVDVGGLCDRYWRRRQYVCQAFRFPGSLRRVWCSRVW